MACDFVHLEIAAAPQQALPFTFLDCYLLGRGGTVVLSFRSLHYILYYNKLIRPRSR